MEAALRSCVCCLPDTQEDHEPPCHSSATAVPLLEGRQADRWLQSPLSTSPPSRGTAALSSTRPRSHRWSCPSPSSHSHMQPHTLPTGTWASPGRPHTDAQSHACTGALPATAPATAHVHGHGCTRIISSQHRSHRVPTHGRTAVLPVQSDTLRHTATSHTRSEQRCHVCRCF